MWIQIDLYLFSPERHCQTTPPNDTESQMLIEWKPKLVQMDRARSAATSNTDADWFTDGLWIWCENSHEFVASTGEAEALPPDHRAHEGVEVKESSAAAATNDRSRLCTTTTDVDCCSCAVNDNVVDCCSCTIVNGRGRGNIRFCWWTLR